MSAGRKSRTRLALAAILWLAGVLATDKVHAQSAQFKGWIATWKELSSRIAPADRPLDVERFLPAEDMEDLLGTWSTFGTEHQFRNGYPNSLSMMIWQVALSSFADAMGQSCLRPQLTFHPAFAATLGSICRWPAVGAQSDDTMRAFWQAVMGYNARESEYSAWRDFIRRDYAKRTAAEAVGAMTLAITLHPSFLLHR